MPPPTRTQTGRLPRLTSRNLTLQINSQLNSQLNSSTLSPSPTQPSSQSRSQSHEETQPATPTTPQCTPSTPTPTPIPKSPSLSSAQSPSKIRKPRKPLTLALSKRGNQKSSPSTFSNPNPTSTSSSSTTSTSSTTPIPQPEKPHQHTTIPEIILTPAPQITEFTSHIQAPQSIPIGRESAARYIYPSHSSAASSSSHYHAHVGKVGNEQEEEGLRSGVETSRLVMANKGMDMLKIGNRYLQVVIEEEGEEGRDVPAKILAE